MRVYLTNTPSPEHLPHLQSNLHPNIIILPEEEAHLAQVLVSGRPSKEQLASSHLTHLIIPWAGLPTSTRQLLTGYPQIRVHNLHHNAQAVAEMALGLLLACARLIIPFDQKLRQGDWTPRYERRSDTLGLHGKTALILGYGAIGQKLAHICHAIGMTIWATRQSVTQPTHDDVAHIYPASSLHQLLKQADVLLICLPHTPQTENLIGARELALLGSKGILINIGRAAVVEEQALYEALRDKTIHSAGLDVWYNYPSNTEKRTQTLPSNAPFHQLENVVFSPHRAGGVDDTEPTRLQHLAHLLNQIAKDPQTKFNQIHLNAGY